MPQTLRIAPRFTDAPELGRVADDTVLVHPDTGLQYRLNATAVIVLGELVRTTTRAALRRRIDATFDVPPDEADRSIDSFVQRMCELGLVEVLDESDRAAVLRTRYLDLLGRALINLIYPEHELRLDHLEHHRPSSDSQQSQRLLRDIRYQQPEAFAGLVACKRTGMNWRRRATRYSHTMIGQRRIEHLAWCASQVFAAGIPGDFLEAGVCQGGASIFMRALQMAYNEPQRLMWVADSFQGLPVPTLKIDRDLDLSEARQPWLAIGLAAVQDNFRTYDLLSNEVRFLSGWFRDTLPGAPIDALAILRIDADLYESTRDVLDTLYDKVSPGGFVIVDDYGAFHPCRAAVDTFRAERAIDRPLHGIDWTAVYWRKAA